MASGLRNFQFHLKPFPKVEHSLIIFHNWKTRHNISLEDTWPFFSPDKIHNLQDVKLVCVLIARCFIYKIMYAWKYATLTFLRQSLYLHCIRLVFCWAINSDQKIVTMFVVDHIIIFNSTFRFSFALHSIWCGRYSFIFYWIQFMNYYGDSLNVSAYYTTHIS